MKLLLTYTQATAYPVVTTFTDLVSQFHTAGIFTAEDCAVAFYDLLAGFRVIGDAGAFGGPFIIRKINNA